MIGAGGVAACGDDDEVTTAASGSSAVTSPTSSAPAVPGAAVVWPLPGAGTTFGSPEDAALSFVREYLDMPAAGMTDSPVPTPDGAVVNVLPNATGGPVTAVSVVRRGEGWAVTGAVAELIDVTSPEPGAGLTSPLAVSGTSTAFEGTVNLELRTLDGGELIGDVGFANGGANGEFAPFAAELAVPAGVDEAVLVVYEADASGRGRVLDATVIVLGARAGAG
ncbi:MAG: Gmad2 immunoglobulin-like domain-containing protein [Acidimicrobiia bacterium]